MTPADRLDRYYRRGFGYYFWREDWLAVLAGVCAVAAAALADIWWIWLLVAVDLVVFGFMVNAAHRAWRALQNLGDTIESIEWLRSLRVD